MYFYWFNIFYDMYKNDFDKLGMSFNDVANIYDINYSTFNLSKKEKNNLYYEDISAKYGYNDRNFSKVALYFTMKDKTGNIIISPFMDSNISDLRAKKTVFSKETVDTISTDTDNLILEAFQVNLRNLSIKIYDKNALKYLSDYNIKFSDLNVIEDKIYNETRLLPDMEIFINKDECIITTIDDNYSEKYEDEFLSYKNLKNEAKKLIKIINERKL